MHHFNNGGWFAEDTKYQTYDFLECPKCHEVAIELYHTEFIKREQMSFVPVFTLKPPL